MRQCIWGSRSQTLKLYLAPPSADAWVSRPHAGVLPMPAGKVPWGQLVSPMQVIYVVGVLGDRCAVRIRLHFWHIASMLRPWPASKTPSGKHQAALS